MVQRALLGLLILIGMGAIMGTSAPAAKMREIGVPVHSVNWVRVLAGKTGGGQPCLYAIMGQQGDNFFVLQIDPATGKFKQFVATGDGANYPTAACMARDGRLYVGAAYAGHLYRFDPQTEKLEDLGGINLPADNFPCRIDEAPDGSLFIGAYGSAGLTRFDPKTGEYTRYGRMDEVDMYCYPLVAPDGIVASEIRMTKPHVVLLDPKTGEKKVVGPTVVAGGKKSIWLFRGTDGELYISGTEGLYHIEGMEAKPVAAVPNAEQPATLPDGSTFAFSDAGDQMYRKLVITDPQKNAKEFTLDYQCSGSDIFLVHQGPDGCIYGSSVLPLHLFRYNPKSGELADLGKCSAAAGEAYSMGNLDGKLYICSYPAAALSVYDPARPYHYGDTADDNPRELGPMDDHISYRPRAMLTGPLGRVWTGSEPNYGLWGGPLAWYDPATGKKASFRHVLRDQSVISLAWLPQQQLIAAGTSIYAGSGTQPRAKLAMLVLWDPKTDTKVATRIVRRGTRYVTSLALAPNGLLYGIAVGEDDKGDFREVFAFDPAGRTFVKHLPIPDRGGVRDNCLLVANGKLYGITTEIVYTIDLRTDEERIIAEIPGELTIPGPIVGKTLYYAKGTSLRALDLP